LQDDKTKNRCSPNASKNEEVIIGKLAIEPECETKRVPLDPRVSDRTVMITQDLSPEEETGLLSFLDKNSDIFACQTSDLTRVSRSIIEHKLQVNPSTKPRKQKLRKTSDEKVTAAKAEVQRMLEVGFIRKVQYPSWLVNVMKERQMENVHIFHCSQQVLSEA
jgi:hypothetical protein